MSASANASRLVVRDVYGGRPGRRTSLEISMRKPLAQVGVESSTVARRAGAVSVSSDERSRERNPLLLTARQLVGVAIHTRCAKAQRVRASASGQRSRRAARGHALPSQCERDVVTGDREMRPKGHSPGRPSPGCAAPGGGAGARRLPGAPPIRDRPLARDPLDPGEERRRVVFPDPDGPSSTSNWPGSTVSDTSMSASAPRPDSAW